jgi:hypothetical protein
MWGFLLFGCGLWNETNQTYILYNVVFSKSMQQDTKCIKMPEIMNEKIICVIFEKGVDMRSNAW